MPLFILLFCSLWLENLWLAEDSKHLLSRDCHLSLMPSKNSFNFLLKLSWKQFLSNCLLCVFAEININDVISSKYLELALFDHGNMSSWVNSCVSRVLVSLFDEVNCVHGAWFLSKVTCHLKWSWWVVNNMSMNGEGFWHLYWSPILTWSCARSHFFLK